MILLTMKSHPRMRSYPGMSSWWNTSQNLMGVAEESTCGEGDCRTWALRLASSLPSAMVVP